MFFNLQNDFQVFFLKNQEMVLKAVIGLEGISNFIEILDSELIPKLLEAPKPETINIKQTKPDNKKISEDVLKSKELSKIFPNLKKYLKFI